MTRNKNATVVVAFGFDLYFQCSERSGYIWQNFAVSLWSMSETELQQIL